MLNSIRPTNDLLVIRRIVDEQPRTAAGILLPPTEESADTPFRGLVLAAGPGKPVKLSAVGDEIVTALQKLLDAHLALPMQTEGPRGINLLHWQRANDALRDHADVVARVPMQVKVGDTVVYSRNGFSEFKIDGETVVVMQEASIMGIIEPEANHV